MILQCFNVSDPCESYPCHSDLKCFPSSATSFRCQTSLINSSCDYQGVNLFHNQTFKDRVRCENGKIIVLFCTVEGRKVLHSEVYKMADGVERQCDHGIMISPKG